MTVARSTRPRRRVHLPARIALVAGLSLVVALGNSFAAATPAGANGSVTVHRFGAAPALGAPSTALNAPVVGIAATRDGAGYWLLGQDGGIFSYGTAAFHGSTGGMRLNRPVVGIAPTPSGNGYWLVASDGGIFSFGDAGFHGSTGGQGIGTTIAGIARTASGHGYWLAGSSGRVFAFGDASAMRTVAPSTPIVGLQVASGGTGLWLVARNGAVYTTGTAPFFGGASGGLVQAVGIARAAGGHGYWIAMVPSGPPLPANSGSGRRIVYSNAQQRLWLVEDSGLVTHSFLVSGRHGLPAVGTYRIWSKVTSSYSGSLLLPFTLRFTWAPSGAPIAIHGIPLSNGVAIEPDSLLGTPQSHGCIRMQQSEVQLVWNWSSIGTTVVVTDVGW